MKNLNLSFLLLPLACNGCPFLRAQAAGGKPERKLQSDYIQELLDNHDDIDREVITNADNSIRTKTTSTRDEVGGWLQEHVATMKARVDNGAQVRNWDPFFVALVDHHDEFDVTITNLDNPKGVQVDMRASTQCGQDLISSHATVVTAFAQIGRVESSKSHDAPTSCGSSGNPPSGGGGGGSSGGGGGSSGTSSNPGGSSNCFSGHSKVLVRNHGPMSVQDLRVGDYVLTDEAGTYQPVYAFGHFNPDRLAMFHQIHHSSSDTPLEVTSDHLLFLAGQDRPVSAAHAKLGDQLRMLDKKTPSTITDIVEVQQAGIYAPLTKDGTIVVDGVVVSTYASLIAESESSDSNQLMEALGQQTYCHLGLAPFRLFCSIAPALCNSYDKDGMPHYISVGIWLTKAATKQRSIIAQWLFMMLFLVLTGPCKLAESLLGNSLTYFIASAVYVMVIARARRQKKKLA